MVAVNYYTDPLCPWSWAAEPAVRKLMVDFGSELRWTFVMAGLHRDLTSGRRGTGVDLPDPVQAPLLRQWLRASSETGAPLDPLIWAEAAPSSSQPACMAFKAAAYQAEDGGYAYLRVLWEGVMCKRRKLDHAEALSEVAREAGLESGRFGVDLRSHGTTEEFGADLERTARLAARGHKAKSASHAGGAPLPAIVFIDDSDVEYGVFGVAPYEAYRDAAVAAGATQQADAALTLAEAVDRFATLTIPEVELLCELPGPRAGLELFKASEQWKLRPYTSLTGYLFERA